MDRKQKIIIVGAGVAGELLKKDIEENNLLWQVLGFVDDKYDQSKGKDNNLSSQPLLGIIDNLPDIVENLKVDKIVIAVPSGRGLLIRRILLVLAEYTDVEVLLLPRSSEVIIDKQVSHNNLREIIIEDLVGEKIDKEDHLEIADYFIDKNILVTGGGGSIGSELSKQIFLFNPNKLIIIDRIEKNLFDIGNELSRIRSKHINTEVIYILGDINNAELIENIFEKNEIDYLFHAAAYKHVPILEENMYEAVYNNVLGTYNMVDIFSRSGGEKFILVSTDKAAKPISFMGKTKKIAENIVNYFGLKYPDSSYRVVRFGNVFNSSGSVVELFIDQVDKKSKITITDKSMTRFFMTIPEAVHLILLSAFVSGSDKKYILEMGEPINILDLAKCLIRVKNRKVSEIQFEEIGIRAGEKHHEVLFDEFCEKKEKTSHERINAIENIENGSKINKESLQNLFALLLEKDVKNHSVGGQKKLLKEINELIR